MAEMAARMDAPAPRGATRDKPVKWRWGAADTVIALCVGLIVIIFAIFGLLCVQGYSTTIDGAKTKAQSAADVVADETEWMLGGARAVLGQIATMAQTPADISDADKAKLDAAVKNLPTTSTLGLYDATGNAWGSAGTPSLPESIADTEMFKSLEAGGQWAISRQLADAATGGPIFVVAQRLGSTAFGGVALLSLSGDVMQDFWAPQKLGPESTTSVAREDGWLVARYPALKETTNVSAQPVFTTQKGDDSGTYVSASSPVDGVARVVAFRRVPQLGLVVFSSVSQDAVLAGLWAAIGTVLWLIGPIALALLVGSLLTARILRQSERTQRNLSAAVAHNEVLFREIHHRVKNNLQSVASLLQMQPIPREIKADMGQRIAAMSAVHEHIYRSNNFSTVRVKDYLQTLVENIRAGQNPDVRVSEQFEDLAVDKDAATPLGLIVNEVVSNAFKHAFADGRAGTVAVTLTRLADGRGCLGVEDNGVGFDPDQPTKGIGRRLIGALTEQLGGQSSFTTAEGGGSRFALTFPLAE